MEGDLRARRDRDGVGHATGQDDPAGPDREAALGELVRGERERLARVALDGRAGRGVDDLAVDLDEDRLEGEVELGRAGGRPDR